MLLKGPEAHLPNGRSFHDKDGHLRHETRLRWWDPAATTFRTAAIGMEARVNWGDGGATAAAQLAERWRAEGATHLAVNTMNCGFATVEEHLEALAEAARALGVRP